MGVFKYNWVFSIHYIDVTGFPSSQSVPIRYSEVPENEAGWSKACGIMGVVFIIAGIPQIKLAYRFPGLLDQEPLK